MSRQQALKRNSEQDASTKNIPGETQEGKELRIEREEEEEIDGTLGNQPGPDDPADQQIAPGEQRSRAPELDRFEETSDIPDSQRQRERADNQAVLKGR